MALLKEVCSFPSANNTGKLQTQQMLLAVSKVSIVKELRIMSAYDHIHSSPEIVQNRSKKAGIINALENGQGEKAEWQNGGIAEWWNSGMDITINLHIAISV